MLPFKRKWALSSVNKCTLERKSVDSPNQRVAALPSERTKEGGGQQSIDEEGKKKVVLFVQGEKKKVAHLTTTKQRSGQFPDSNLGSGTIPFLPHPEGNHATGKQVQPTWRKKRKYADRSFEYREGRRTRFVSPALSKKVVPSMKENALFFYVRVDIATAAKRKRNCLERPFLKREETMPFLPNSPGFCANLPSSPSKAALM